MPGFPDNSGNGVPAPVVASADPPPLRPLEPGLADCCGDGCARCVFDIYEEALARFEIDLATWCLRQQHSGDNGHSSLPQE